MKCCPNIGGDGCCSAVDDGGNNDDDDNNHDDYNNDDDDNNDGTSIIQQSHHNFKSIQSVNITLSSSLVAIFKYRYISSQNKEINITTTYML